MAYNSCWSGRADYVLFPFRAALAGGAPLIVPLFMTAFWKLSCKDERRFLADCDLS